jgi:hypothetical protein
MIEVWKDIPKFEGIYQVSNFGYVKRLPYEKIQPNGGSYWTKDKILKSTKKDYFSVNLRNGSYQRSFLVNRLVYGLFNDVKIQRNHLIIPKDGNFLNCNLDNLKLITKRNFVSAKMNNITGYTGVCKNNYDEYIAKIDFEGITIHLHASKDKEVCHKLYQSAKKCFEEYDKLKIEILSNYAKNRLTNKNVKL